MAEVTPNIGLKKPLESEFVSIQTLNENMDKVDQSLGAVSELPTTAKNAAGAISEIYDQLADKPQEQLTLTPGVQIVQGGDVPAILHPTMQGRTLVNLLGRVGNCDNIADWTLYDSNNSKSLDTSHYKYGISSLRLTIANNSFSIGAANTNVNVENGKHYVAVSEIRNNDISGGVRVRIYGVSSLQDRLGNTIGLGTSFKTSYRTYSATVTEKVQVYGLFGQNVASANGQFATFDGVRLYEITATEKTYIDNLPTAEAQAYISAKYPYVDDMKHVNAVYIENKGKNLLPPFSEWTFQSDCNAIGAYEAVINGTSSYKQISCVVSVKPNTEYVVSAIHNAFIAVYDGAGLVAIKTLQGSQSVNFNSGNNERVMIILGNATSTGVFTFKNPMLNIGSEPLPFEPQKPSYLYLPDCNLRSNVDGSVSDRLYTDGQGKPRVTRRFREISLDGSLAWGFSADFAGYKRIYSPSFSDYIGELNRASTIKYDGKVLVGITTSAFTAADQMVMESDKRLYLSIANTDSGWGEDYTPTADEIKAYFYGWKMYHYESGNGSTTFNGTGTKAWGKRVNGTSSTTLYDTTTTLPTTLSSDWTPYRLMYQLAQSVDEPVTYEGFLMLHEGDNQVEVGTGIVVREAANPQWYSAGNQYQINGGGVPSSKLKLPLGKPLSVYKSAELDKSWKFANGPFPNFGNWYLTNTQIDPTAAYSVTYLALDTYTLGIAPQTISAEYAPNIRESVESLVREVIEARTETSVLQNTKAQKQQPQWIEATLRNDWTGALKYSKSDDGYVTLSFALTVGINALNTIVCALPKGYLSVSNVGIPTLNNNTGTTGLGLTINGTLGGISVSGSANFSTGHLIYGTITYKGR